MWNYEEFEILNRIEKDIFSTRQSVASIEDVKFIQDLTKRVYLDDAIKHYIIQIIDATRNPAPYIGPQLAQYITLGASTRGAIALMDASKAIALINGRDFVIPEDVKNVIFSVLRHRISLNYLH